ncbi:MAG TPA: YHS domain-containing protein [Gemmatimonadaceae bacterium]
MIDPVCGMAVDPETAAAHARYEDRDYYFCSIECEREFNRNPAKYRHADASVASGRRDEPPFTKTGPIVAPKFGSAGSGGAEYEPLPGDDPPRSNR